MIIRPIFMFQPVMYFTLLFSAATGKGSTTMPWLVVTMIGIVIFPIGVFAGCKWIFKHFSSIPFFPPFQFSSALWMLCSASTSGSWSSRSGLLLAMQYNCNDADCEAESLLSALSQFAKVWWYILYYFLKRFQTFMCDDTTSTLFLKYFKPGRRFRPTESLFEDSRKTTLLLSNYNWLIRICLDRKCLWYEIKH